MLKVRKIGLVVIGIMLVSLIFGSMSAYATNVRTITANTNSSSNSTNTDSNTNTDDTNTDTNTNTDEDTNRVNSISSSNYSNTPSTDSSNRSDSSSLPYTGTKSSVVFVALALVVSAVYAFKKVSEYKNV